MKAKICVIAGILAIGLLVVACNVIGKQGDVSLKDVLVSEYFYGENEEVLFYLDYEYDSNGNRIKDTFYQVSFFRDNEISSYFEYAYDSNGNITEYRRYGAIGEISTPKKEYEYKYHSKREYEYDSDGNLIKALEYDENGELSSYDVYEYDAKENQIKYNWYLADGELRMYEEYEYDSNGNKIKSKTYENDVLLGYVEYAYDSGLVIKSNHYDQNNELIYYSDYFYDDKKNLIKVFAYEDSVDGNPTMTIIYNYKEI